MNKPKTANSGDSIKLPMNAIVNCILINGVNSSYVNNFIKICTHEVRLHILQSKFRDFLLNKTGCSLDDLSIDLVADLFETRDNKFYFIEKYFGDKRSKIMDFPEDELHKMIKTLVRSSANQRISEIRQDFGEVYFWVKKAVDILLTRKPQIYKKIFINSSIFIYTCDNKNVDMDLLENQMGEEELVRNLFTLPFKTYQIPEIISNIFEIINSADEYSKAVDKQKLVNSVTQFYKLRLNSKITDKNNEVSILEHLSEINEYSGN